MSGLQTSCFDAARSHEKPAVVSLSKNAPSKSRSGRMLPSSGAQGIKKGAKNEVKKKHKETQKTKKKRNKGMQTERKKKKKKKEIP